jgi:integrase
MHRAYTLCQAQSGLSVSDLLRVTYGDLEKQFENDADHIHLRLLRGKEKQLGFFDTFFGEMATEALKQYLLTRNGLEGPSRIFCCTARNVNSLLGRMSVRAGIGWRVSSHDLRKFFATSLKLARVNDPAFNETLVEYWQGHSLGKVRGAYFVPPVEEQLCLYKLAEKRLEPKYCN